MVHNASLWFFYSFPKKRKNISGIEKASGIAQNGNLQEAFFI